MHNKKVSDSLRSAAKECFEWWDVLGIQPVSKTAAFPTHELSRSRSLSFQAAFSSSTNHSSAVQSMSEPTSPVVDGMSLLSTGGKMVMGRSLLQSPASLQHSLVPLQYQQQHKQARQRQEKKKQQQQQQLSHSTQSSSSSSPTGLLGDFPDSVVSQSDALISPLLATDGSMPLMIFSPLLDAIDALDQMDDNEETGDGSAGVRLDDLRPLLNSAPEDYGFSNLEGYVAAAEKHGVVLISFQCDKIFLKTKGEQSF